MKPFRNHFLHLIFAITAISLHAQCPEQLSNTSFESESGARLILEYVAAAPIATQIFVDFGAGDSRNGIYSVSIHNTNLLRTASQGTGFFSGDLNASITVNSETCAFNETTPPECVQWAGNCNIDDNIYRNGNVFIGMTPPPPGFNIIGKINVEADINEPVGIISTSYYSAFCGYSNSITSPTMMLTNGTGGDAAIFQGNIGITGRIKLGASSIRRESGHLLINPSFKFHDNGTFETDDLKVNSTLETNRLDVLEEMYAKKITVRLPPFPDYVFADNYDLMPLGDLKKYIRENRHLPNIPSAKEVEVNGADLGNLQVLQMEKIEELTLYILEMNERLEKLEKENIELLKRLKE